MRAKQIVNEGLGDEAAHMELDHEVQMARAQLYHAAKDAIRLHKIMQGISEREGLEGWVAAKITMAADYLKTVADYMEYNNLDHNNPEAIAAPSMPVGEMTSAASVAAVPMPMGKVIKRKK